MQKVLDILVMDHDKNLCKSLEYNLHLEGFRVYIANSAVEGLKLAHHYKLDVILLDMLLPKMDGLQVLAELKYNDKTSEIPVFMLNEKGNFHELERALDIGAVDYISKPFDVEDIGKFLRKKLHCNAG